MMKRQLEKKLGRMQGVKMSVVKKLVKFIFITSLVTIALCLFLLTYFFYFLLSSDLSERLLKQVALRNDNVSVVKILESEMDFPFYRHDVEITTKKGDKIFFHYVKWPLNNRGIQISQINDIGLFGGQIYELKGDSKILYEPDDIAVLGKMLGVKLKSVGDVIDNVEQLYELYNFFESKAAKEYLYKDQFLIHAAFTQVSDEL